MDHETHLQNNKIKLTCLIQQFDLVINLITFTDICATRICTLHFV